MTSKKCRLEVVLVSVVMGSPRVYEDAPPCSRSGDPLDVRSVGQLGEESERFIYGVEPRGHGLTNEAAGRARYQIRALRGRVDALEYARPGAGVSPGVLAKGEE